MGSVARPSVGSVVCRANVRDVPVLAEAKRLRVVRLVPECGGALQVRAGGAAGNCVGHSGMGRPLGQPAASADNLGDEQVVECVFVAPYRQPSPGCHAWRDAIRTAGARRADS